MAVFFRGLIVGIFCTTVAQAQDSNADTFFNKGVDAMEAGKFDEACPAIAESQRLDPRMGTLFTLAECEGKRGKNLVALGHYQDFLRQFEALPEAQKSKQAARKKISEDSVARLQASLGKLSLSGVPSDAEVSLDGQPLAATSWRETVVEPGTHRIVIRQKGSEKTTEVSVQAGEFRTVTPELPASAAPPPPVVPPTSTPPSPSPAPFYAAAGVGAVGLLVGTVSGVLALSSKSTVKEECAGLVCSRRGLDAVESGRTRANVSTVGFVLGVLGVGAAAGLWFSGISKPGSARGVQMGPVVAADRAGWMVGGRW